MSRRDPSGKDATNYLNWPSPRGFLQSSQNYKKCKDVTERLSPPRSPRGMSPRQSEERVKA